MPRDSYYLPRANLSHITRCRAQDEGIRALFENGVDVYSGYVDDPRNTDNAWMESHVAHFHCPNELGEMIPVHVASKSSATSSTKSGQVCWLDADLALEPRYATMVRHPREAPRLHPHHAMPAPHHATTPHT